MIQTMRNAWKVPELRAKLLFTVFALLIFRLGSAIPVFVQPKLDVYIAFSHSSESSFPLRRLI